MLEILDKSDTDFGDGSICAIIQGQKLFFTFFSVEFGDFQIRKKYMASYHYTNYVKKNADIISC